MKQLHLLPLALLLSLHTARAQQPATPLTDPSLLSTALDSLIADRLPNVAPGCVTLVVSKGQVIYKKALGWANLEQHVPMQTNMVFRIGSMTKQFTAVAVLQLMEQGKLSLHDTIQQYIPDYPVKDHPVTIENLLTHTSGITGYEVLDIHIPDAIRIDFPPKQLIDSLGKLPLEFVPGSTFHYSNSNYFLLAYIIEQVSGKSYPDYLATNLFVPAGLSSTWYDDPKAIIPNRASGYARYQMQYSNADYISMTQVYGAGALISTVEDLYKWHQALYAYKLVKKETLEKAFTPFKLTNGELSGYGYGWFIKKRNGYPTIEHAGGIDGFQSDGIYFPQQDLFIATLYNSLNEGGDDVSFIGLDNDIATLSVGEKLTHAITLDSAVLKQYVGVYKTDPKHAAIITLENGQLQMEAPAGGLPKSALFAKSANVFFLKIIDAEIEFIKKGNEVTQFVVHFNGKTEVAKKVK